MPRNSLWCDFLLSVEVEPEMEYLNQYGQSSGAKSGTILKIDTGDCFPFAEPANVPLPVPKVDQPVLSGSGVFFLLGILQRPKESRLSYRDDGDKELPGESVFSVDFQKVSSQQFISYELIF